MERWWCMDCKTPVELDTHGRCLVCQSEAVDLIERGRPAAIEKAIAALTVTGGLQSA
jgi:Zn finger protein HypA/HybF involved in hydrogenase expression